MWQKAGSAPQFITMPQRVNGYEFIVFVPKSNSTGGVYIYNSKHMKWKCIIPYEYECILYDLHISNWITAFNCAKRIYYVYCRETGNLLTFDISSKTLMQSIVTKHSDTKLFLPHICITNGKLNMYAIRCQDDSLIRFIYNENTFSFDYKEIIATDTAFTFKMLETNDKLFIFIEDFNNDNQKVWEPRYYRILSTNKKIIHWKNNKMDSICPSLGKVDYLPDCRYGTSSIHSNTIFFCNAPSYLRDDDDTILKYNFIDKTLAISRLCLPMDHVFLPVIIHHNIYTVNLILGYGRKLNKLMTLPNVVAQIIVNNLAVECLHILSRDGDHFWVKRDNI